MLIVYSKKLNCIKDEILAIGEVIVEANELALKALESSKYELFDKAKKRLQHLEKTSDKIDNMIINILALYAPEAKDLRVLVSFLKITEELIRTSDNTKDFIKGLSRATASKHMSLEESINHIIELHKSTIKALKRSLEITHIEYEHNMQSEYKPKDIFNDVLQEESKTDDLCTIAQNHIFNSITKHQEFTKEYCEVLSAIRRLEKIADRAVSIANLLLFAKLGGEMHQA